MASDLEYLVLADLVYNRFKKKHIGYPLNKIFNNEDNFTSEKKDTKIRWKTYKNYVGDWEFLEAYDPDTFNNNSTQEEEKKEEPTLEEKQFYAAAFQSPDEEEIVIAYRGTDGDNGEYDDIWSFFGKDIEFLQGIVDVDFAKEHGVTNRKIGVATPGRQFEFLK